MKIGSLFSGYGGLDMAVQEVIGGDLAWYSEIEPAACTVLTSHHPGVQNLGDITKVDWSCIPTVDVLTGGYPCQPFSQAGKRKGTNDERHLWPYVREAIDALRPSLVVLENVRGHLTLGFGDVLADLSRVGYDAKWGVVRASDAGAPHRRARLFIVAYPNGEQNGDNGQSGRLATQIIRNGSFCRSSKDLSAGISHQDDDDQSRSHQTDFGPYATAVRRWERLINRPAPPPSTTINNKPRLNPVFVEWMMGLPEGHVTGHGLSNAQALKMLGNGVVPQQAALALRMLGL